MPAFFSTRPFRRVFAFPALLLLLATTTSTRAHALPALFLDERPWVAFDGPLWDMSDDGLPFRLSVVQPATADPIGRLLRSTDQQWTAWVGYADVRSKVTGSGEVRASGGEALMAGFGRQWRWRLPAYTAVAGWRPHLTFETGVNYADDSLPSDGSHFNFPVVTGFEWSRLGADGEDDRSPWVFGFRWFHLSNAHLLEKNSGYDGIIFRVGRRWDW
jgi:hypothetical protein